MNRNTVVMTFHFDAIEAEEQEANITALVQIPDGRDVADIKAGIEDCIASYIESVEAWSFDGLVRDVLGSFSDITFTIPEPIVFNI